MNGLEIARYTLIPLAVLSFIIWLYYLLAKKNSESLTISPKINTQTFTQPKPDSHTESESNQKEQSIRIIHNIPKRQETGFKSKNYRIGHLAKLTSRTLDIKAHLSKLKSLPTAASKLRKMSKKSNSSYLKMLMKKEPKQKETQESIPALQRVSDISDKRAKIINKLRRIHH